MMKLIYNYVLLAGLFFQITHTMEIPKDTQTVYDVDIFEQFEGVAKVLVSKVRAAGKQVTDQRFNKYFLTLWAKAITDSKNAGLTEPELKTFNTFINNCAVRFKDQTQTLDLVKAINDNKGARNTITKILCRNKSQLDLLKEAFAKVDPQYATQQEIGLLIAQVCNKKQKEVKKEAQPVDDEQESFNLAWQLQQEEMQDQPAVTASSTKRDAKPESDDAQFARKFMEQEQQDAEYARQLSNADSNQHNNVPNSEQDELELALAFSLQEAKKVQKTSPKSQPKNSTINIKNTFVPKSFDEVMAQNDELDLLAALELSEKVNNNNTANGKQEVPNNQKAEQIKEEKEKCPICLEEFKNDDITLNGSKQCDHKLHLECHDKLKTNLFVPDEINNPNYKISFGCPTCGKGREDNSTNKNKIAGPKKK